MIQTWPIVGRARELREIIDGLRRGVGSVVVGEAGRGKSALLGEVQRQMIGRGEPAHLVQCSGRSDFPLHDVIADAGGGRANRATVLVDDAHLLDDDSAEALWRLVSDTSVRVVATIRSNERTPDRIARLWTAGSCRRLDLGALDEPAIRELLEVVLGGDVEDRLPRLLSVHAAGNALVLRELIRAGVGSGAIAPRQGVWRLVGDLPVGAGVADVIRAGLAELTPDEFGAAQLLAVGEPLALAQAESAIGPDLLESLEDKRVAGLARTSHGPVVTLGHPLYGEILRAQIAPLRLRRLRRELIAVFERGTALDPRDRLRSIAWRLDLGDAPTPAELIAAAREARAVSRSTAEELARAAVAAEPTIEALVLLAEILIMQGRIAEADALLDDLDLRAAPIEDRNAVTYVRALGRTRLGELGAVITMVTGAGVSPGANSAHLQAIYGQSLMLLGRTDEGTTVVRALLEDPDADPVARTIAACGLLAGGAIAGRTAESVGVLEEALPAAEAAATVMPFGPGTLMVATAIGQAASGRLDEAEAIGRQMYERSLTQDDEWMRPRGATALGLVALLRGRVRTAYRYLRISVASLNDLDQQYLRYTSSHLVRAAVLTGHLREARHAFDAAAAGPDFPIFDPDWLIAQAALHAAEGSTESATACALTAARRAASLGLWGVMGAAAHEAARYTAAPEAVQLTATAAERVDGPLIRCLADVARARHADDPDALSDASDRLRELGFLLYAAEASYAAAQACRRQGRAAAAARSGIRAADLHAACENALIPWSTGFQAGQPLTRRELEVALLASTGRSDAAIAAELHVSVRTVQNHLARAYRKLAITGRRDLPRVLTFRAGAQADHRLLGPRRPAGLKSIDT